MSEGTRVFHQGSTATFHPNKGSADKGFIYRDGRRVYGSISESVTGRTLFVGNHDTEQAVAQPA